LLIPWLLPSVHFVGQFPFGRNASVETLTHYPAEKLGAGVTKLNQIHQATQAYLDGRGISQTTWQQMQDDLQQQKQQRIRSRQKDLGLEM